MTKLSGISTGVALMALTVSGGNAGFDIMNASLNLPRPALKSAIYPHS
jgi:hypothetical protein